MLLDQLLTLNDSLVGFASFPELLCGVLALWAISLCIVDGRRGSASLAETREAAAEDDPVGRALQPRLFALEQRVSSDRARLTCQIFFLGFALVLMFLAPDYVRPNLRWGLWIITVAACVAEGIQIRDLRKIARTWERINEAAKPIDEEKQTS